MVIPSSVTSIGCAVFSGCDKLESLRVDADNPIYDSRENCNAIIETSTNKLVAGSTKAFIPNTVVSINNLAFYFCRNIRSINIPNTVTFIGAEAFGCCYELESVTLPDSITTIYEETFSNCRSLKEIVIPSTVTSIRSMAFEHCDSLEYLIIPKSVTGIGDYPFRGCGSLTSITVEEGNPTFDSRENCNAIIKTSTNALILGCMNTVIPNSVTLIGKYAFQGCKHLTSITIPDLVTRINDGAFMGCSSLESITLPGRLSYIAEATFYNCKALKSITCLAINPPYIDVSQYCPTFDSSVYRKTKVYVPNASITAYKEAKEWKRFYLYYGIMNVVFGDFNGDGKVSISDITTMIDLLLRGGDLPDYADLNNDGTVTISDLTVLIDLLLNSN